MTSALLAVEVVAVTTVVVVNVVVVVAVHGVGEHGVDVAEPLDLTEGEVRLVERLVVGRHLGERFRALDERLGGRGVEATLVDIEGVEPCGVAGGAGAGQTVHESGPILSPCLPLITQPP